ncbi:MAG TPA: biopolymer transporter ExbD [Opitutaceae bacterium]
MLHSIRDIQGERKAGIDLAPMIDCVFLLLIFFIVTSVFRDDPGVEVRRPDVTGAAVTARNALVIAISADDRIHFDGQEIRLDQVASLLRNSALGNETPLVIRADRAASHGRFASVYAEAKRAEVGPVQFATVRAEQP